MSQENEHDSVGQFREIMAGEGMSTEHAAPDAPGAPDSSPPDEKSYPMFNLPTVAEYYRERRGGDEDAIHTYVSLRRASVPPIEREAAAPDEPSAPDSPPPDEKDRDTLHPAEYYQGLWNEDEVPQTDETAYVQEFVAQSIDYLDVLTELLARKNYMYGSESIKTTGGYGVVVRAYDKVARLLSMHQKNLSGEGADESRLDTWRDLMGYAFIGYAMELGAWDKITRDANEAVKVAKKARGG